MIKAVRNCGAFTSRHTDGRLVVCDKLIDHTGEHQATCIVKFVTTVLYSWTESKYIALRAPTLGTASVVQVSTQLYTTSDPGLYRKIGGLFGNLALGWHPEGDKGWHTFIKNEHAKDHGDWDQELNRRREGFFIGYHTSEFEELETNSLNCQ